MVWGISTIVIAIPTLKVDVPNEATMIRAKTRDGNAITPSTTRCRIMSMRFPRVAEAIPIDVPMIVAIETDTRPTYKAVEIP